MADLDEDGHVDLLSGSWPGELFWFRGDAQREFAAPVMLRNDRGKVINIGGGIEYGDGEISITGHGVFDSDEQGSFVRYHDQIIRHEDGTVISTTGTASAVHAADWDDDGDLDLLVGDIRGRVYLIPNEGRPGKPSYGKHRRLCRVEGGDAGPFAADWDGDGDLDLLVGSGDGSVTLFRNIRDQLRAGEQLIPPGTTGFRDDVPSEPRRGGRSKVCAADWNGDGHLDLLVGDYTRQKPDLPEFTDAEKEVHALARAKLDEIWQKRGSLIMQLYRPDPERDSDAIEAISDELRAIDAEVEALRAIVPPESETHGWVWLFLRKPPATAEATVTRDR